MLLLLDLVEQFGLVGTLITGWLDSVELTHLVFERLVRKLIHLRGSIDRPLRL